MIGHSCKERVCNEISELNMFGVVNTYYQMSTYMSPALEYD